MIDFSGALTTQRVTVTPPRFVREEIQTTSVEREWRKDLVDDALVSSMERNPLLTGSNGAESERALHLVAYNVTAGPNEKLGLYDCQRG